MAIDPTARIASGATMGRIFSIGPYCVIGPHVVLGDDCALAAHVCVAGHTTIGARTRIQPFASLGSPPQSVKNRGGPTRLVLGVGWAQREDVHISPGHEEGCGAVASRAPMCSGCAKPTGPCSSAAGRFASGLTWWPANSAITPSSAA